MTLAVFLIGLLVGAAMPATLLIPRLRSAIATARGAAEAERAAIVELDRAAERREAELESARLLSAERASAHERQLSELRAATEEKIALVSGNREQLAEQMKAVSKGGRAHRSGPAHDARAGAPDVRVHEHRGRALA